MAKDNLKSIGAQLKNVLNSLPSATNTHSSESFFNLCQQREDNPFINSKLLFHLQELKSGKANLNDYHLSQEDLNRITFLKHLEGTHAEKAAQEKIKTDIEAAHNVFPQTQKTKVTKPKKAYPEQTNRHGNVPKTISLFATSLHPTLSQQAASATDRTLFKRFNITSIPLWLLPIDRHWPFQPAIAGNSPRRSMSMTPTSPPSTVTPLGPGNPVMSQLTSDPLRAHASTISTLSSDRHPVWSSLSPRTEWKKDSFNPYSRGYSASSSSPGVKGPAAHSGPASSTNPERRFSAPVLLQDSGGSMTPERRGSDSNPPITVSSADKEGVHASIHTARVPDKNPPADHRGSVRDNIGHTGIIFPHHTIEQDTSSPPTNPDWLPLHSSSPLATVMPPSPVSSTVSGASGAAPLPATYADSAGTLPPHASLHPLPQHSQDADGSSTPEGRDPDPSPSPPSGAPRPAQMPDLYADSVGILNFAESLLGVTAQQGSRGSMTPQGTDLTPPIRAPRVPEEYHLTTRSATVSANPPFTEDNPVGSGRASIPPTDMRSTDQILEEPTTSSPMQEFINYDQKLKECKEAIQGYSITLRNHQEQIKALNKDLEYAKAALAERHVSYVRTLIALSERTSSLAEQTAIIQALEDKADRFAALLNAHDTAKAREAQLEENIQALQTHLETVRSEHSTLEHARVNEAYITLSYYEKAALVVSHHRTLIYFMPRNTQQKITEFLHRHPWVMTSIYLGVYVIAHNIAAAARLPTAMSKVKFLMHIAPFPIQEYLTYQLGEGGQWYSPATAIFVLMSVKTVVEYGAPHKFLTACQLVGQIALVPLSLGKYYLQSQPDYEPTGLDYLSPYVPLMSLAVMSIFTLATTGFGISFVGGLALLTKAALLSESAQTSLFWMKIISDCVANHDGSVADCTRSYFMNSLDYIDPTTNIPENIPNMHVVELAGTTGDD